ncbi:MAG: hypothetical protein ACI37Z_09750 [Candidatus Gastranaerophilaceae bacterium]
MKNLLQTTIVLAATAIFSAPAFADGLIFDPDTYPVKPVNSTVVAQNSTSTTAHPYANKSEYSVSTTAVNTKTVQDIQNSETRQNNNMQNALFELDSAQVDIRNQLIDARAKYTDIDNQYKLIKEQRKIQKQTVKDAERRINRIEKTKNQIRKSMQIN